MLIKQLQQLVKREHSLTAQCTTSVGNFVSQRVAVSNEEIVCKKIWMSIQKYLKNINFFISIIQVLIIINASHLIFISTCISLNIYECPYKNIKNTNFFISIIQVLIIINASHFIFISTCISMNIPSLKWEEKNPHVIHTKLAQLGAYKNVSLPPFLFNYDLPTPPFPLNYDLK